ncbi:hypothetical protein [Bacillus sp. AFS076308]|uniref:hypothetical protein n=1 Tax=Bacillus sp. AFS076308 TaxID=2033512 RepID=UPI001596750E|nr:hypothetical protein [Bacillus sp. AFS076308]
MTSPKGETYLFPGSKFDVPEGAPFNPDVNGIAPVGSQDDGNVGGTSLMQCKASAR